MNKADRAAQFQPFDALKGLQEELREREERRTRVEKKELSEERVDEISSALAKIYKRMEVEVTFYCSGHYYNIKGLVVDKNDIYKYLVVGEGKIFYDDIYEIKLL